MTTTLATPTAAINCDDCGELKLPRDVNHMGETLICTECQPIPAPEVAPEVTPVDPYRVKWALPRTDAEWIALAAGLRAYAVDSGRKEQESFDRCDTDGALSQWGNSMTAQLCLSAATLAENHGRMQAEALFDIETGELVPAKLIKTRFGWAWGILADADPSSSIIAWVNESTASTAKARARHYAKHGYTLGVVEVPAKADLGGGSIASVSAVWKRVDGGFSADATIVTRRETD